MAERTQKATHILNRLLEFLSLVLGMLASLFETDLLLLVHGKIFDRLCSCCFHFL